MRRQLVGLFALTFFTLGASPQKPDNSAAPKGWNIELYDQTRYRGAGKTYTRSVPDLGAAQSRRVKSLIIGRGLWQICDKPNYNGNCRVLRSSIADLYVWGFTGPVRSIRPVVPKTPPR